MIYFGQTPVLEQVMYLFYLSLEQKHEQQEVELKRNLFRPKPCAYLEVVFNFGSRFLVKQF